MSKLKTLSFCSVPTTPKNPIVDKRQRLIERLEQQRQLAANPNFTISAKKTIRNADGSKTVTERQQRLKQWWRVDEKGTVILSVKMGFKAFEFEKGKAGIAVGSAENLDPTLQTLIEAVRAGELDAALSASNRKASQ